VLAAAAAVVIIKSVLFGYGCKCFFHRGSVLCLRCCCLHVSVSSVCCLLMQSYDWMSHVLQAVDSIHQVGIYCLALVPPNCLPKVRQTLLFHNKRGFADYITSTIVLLLWFVTVFAVEFRNCGCKVNLLLYYFSATL